MVYKNELISDIPMVSFYTPDIYIYIYLWDLFDHFVGLAIKGLTSLYDFYPLYRHLDISRVITAESSTLDIGSSRTRTGNLWFSIASLYVIYIQYINCRRIV